MNKSESKYFYTARLLDEAMAALLAEKDLEFITVKELCERAGVNRSTFYLHYETIADLLRETVDNILKSFLETFPQFSKDFVPGIRNAKLEDLILVNEAYLVPYLTFIKENRNVFRASFRNPGAMDTHRQFEDVCRYVLIPIMSRFEIPEKERSYRLGFYIQGCMSIIREWLIRDCEESVEEVANIIISCVRPQPDFAAE